MTRDALRRRFAVLALVVTAGCGGGGGGGTGPAPTTIAHDFGLVASTVPVVQNVVIVNPLGDAATLAPDGAVGAFSADVASLPTSAAANAPVAVPLRFSASGVAGPYAGSVTIRFAGGGSSATVKVTTTATAEPVTLTVGPAGVAFGEVLPGDSATRPIVVTNASLRSPAHLTNLLAPAAFPTTPLGPMTLAPGGVLTLEVAYAPTAPGAPAGFVSFHADDAIGTHVVPVAATSGGKEVVDLGAQAFTAGDTGTLSVVVPADAISFAIEASTTSTTTIGLAFLTGPDGEVFENTLGTGAYLQWLDKGEYFAQVPNTDRSGLQLVPGTWTFAIRRYSGSATTVTVRTTVERRPGGTGGVGTLDLNVFLANAITPKAATAAGNADLQDVVARIDTILAQQGIRVGAITYYDVADPTYDDVTQAEFPELLKLSAAATKERLNYFLVRTAIGGGVLGIAAKIGGGARLGTATSGVMGLWIDAPSASQRDLLARVAAHEMGHFLGLYHTAESSGTTHDIIDDTAECGSGGCGTPSTLYLMHWNASPGGAILTNGQGLVLRGHPLVFAAVPAQSGAIHAAYFLPPAPWPPIEVSPDWCATCREPPNR